MHAQGQADTSREAKNHLSALNAKGGHKINKFGPRNFLELALVT